jgi:hypothetical protein
VCASAEKATPDRPATSATAIATRIVSRAALRFAWSCDFGRKMLFGLGTNSYSLTQLLFHCVALCGVLLFACAYSEVSLLLLLLLPISVLSSVLTSSPHTYRRILQRPRQLCEHRQAVPAVRPQLRQRDHGLHQGWRTQLGRVQLAPLSVQREPGCGVFRGSCAAFGGSQVRLDLLFLCTVLLLSRFDVGAAACVASVSALYWEQVLL